MQDAIVVLDAGSSSLKAALFDQTGVLRKEIEKPLPPAAHPHRRSPDDWWAAAKLALREIDTRKIGAIVLTGTMENLIPVAADGSPLGAAIMYSDGCGAAYCEAMSTQLEAADFIRIAGNAPEPLMTCFKLAWLKDHEASAYGSARWFLPGAKDYLAFKLTGRAVTDPTTAATTGLMDIVSRQWDDRLLRAFDVDGDRLPEILPATAVVGNVSSSIAAELGFARDLPVINGCGDAGATTLGGGAESLDDISIYLGTSGWVARVVEAGLVEEAKPFYRLPHPLSGSIIAITPILSAGAATQWAQKVLGLELEEAERLAGEADRDPQKVLFLPYLSGERFPFVDLDVRGSFMGLCADHTAGDLYYAVLEGVAFAIASNVEAMNTGKPSKLNLSGGGALSHVWPSILADIAKTEVGFGDNPLSSTAFGACRVALTAQGKDVAASSFPVRARPRLDRINRVQHLRDCYSQATSFLRSLKF